MIHKEKEKGDNHSKKEKGGERERIHMHFELGFELGFELVFELVFKNLSLVSVFGHTTATNTCTAL